MSQKEKLSAAAIAHIAQQLNVPVRSVLATVTLLDEGGTVPFIARYRKEATGNLDEVAIGTIQEQAVYFYELDQRRSTILKTIDEQGKLTAELKTQLEATLDKTVLEDLYLPFRPKRRTKAMVARERGLAPLADYLWNQLNAEVTLPSYAASFVDPAKEVLSVEDALGGARHIIAEQISETAEFRAALRKMMFSEGRVISRYVEDAQDTDGKFKMYADYSEPAATIPSHRMLAIRRGANENILYFSIEMDPLKPVAYLKSKILREPGDWTEHLQLAIEDAWRRLLNLSIQTEVRLELKERSDLEAIRVFRENLQNLLLAPPAGMITVLGLDPGLRTGCKLAVVDETGKFLHHDVIYPLVPRQDVAGASATLLTIVRKFNVRAVAIGNGTGSRETESFVRDFFRESALADIFHLVVNESGASVYSASELARQEFPDLDLTVRGAISIARRLQDPLAELVKIDPKSIGVGQYQHDVDQRKLGGALESTIETCVNRVGVDLNTASFALLRHIAGINERTALNIVKHRDEKGRFSSRAQLRTVSGFGPKTFEQAAGFLRIRDGDNPLDKTAVHPESYELVSRMAESLHVTVGDLISQPALAETIPIKQFVGTSAGAYTLRDIQEELRKPGRDPRARFVVPQFSSIHEIADLAPGMTLEGVVTNVTNFGAFVDIGVHQDGLVHISELANQYVKNPHEVVRAGEIVRVQVLSADAKNKRIALSIKALQTQSLPKIKNAPQTPRREGTFEEKIAGLASRFHRN